MVSIRTSFYPFRLIMARKEPVQLTIDLKNDKDETKAYSVQLELPRSLSLDRVGPKINEYKMLGNLNPGQEKRVYYTIFAKANADENREPIELHVHEHPKDSKGPHDVVQTFTRKLDLTVQHK